MELIAVGLSDFHFIEQRIIFSWYLLKIEVYFDTALALSFE